MQDPKHQLSTAERRMLSAIASGNEEFTPDFVALHRLRAFGFTTETPAGRATITKEGMQALHLARVDPA
jgi:hypothetical protein